MDRRSFLRGLSAVIVAPKLYVLPPLGGWHRANGLIFIRSPLERIDPSIYQALRVDDFSLHAAINANTRRAILRRLRRKVW